MDTVVPSLAQVLALRPAAGGAADFRAAIAQAEELHAAMLARAGDLEASRESLLLKADTTEILALDQQATEARLAAERLEALSPLLQGDLAGAEGREVLEALRREAEAANAATAAMAAWREKDLRRITESLAVGFALEDRAAAAHAGLLARADAFYRRQEVRDAGPIGVNLAPLPASTRAAFPGWR